MTKMLEPVCSQAAAAASETTAKAAARSASRGNVSKQEKAHNLTKAAHSFNAVQSCCSQCITLLACVQDESSETTGTMVDESATQGTKICIDYEPCKKTVGCSRLCPIGQKGGVWKGGM